MPPVWYLVPTTQALKKIKTEASQKNLDILKRFLVQLEIELNVLSSNMCTLYISKGYYDMDRNKRENKIGSW